MQINLDFDLVIIINFSIRLFKTNFNSEKMQYFMLILLSTI